MWKMFLCTESLNIYFREMTLVSLSVLLHVCACGCARMRICIDTLILLLLWPNILLYVRFESFQCYCTMHPVWLELHPVNLESMIRVSNMGPISYCGFLLPLPFVEPLFLFYMLKFIRDFTWYMLENLPLFLFIPRCGILQWYCYYCPIWFICVDVDVCIIVSCTSNGNKHVNSNKCNTWH